jgi:putative copper resistance protein D
MLDASPWALATLLSKLVAYAGFVSFAGGMFVFWLGTRPSADSAPNAATLWSPSARAFLLARFLAHGSAALLALLVYFLLQIGQINQAGLRGMFDPFMTGIVLQSSVGHGVLLRCAAIALLLAGLWQARAALLAPTLVRLPPRLLVSWLAAVLLFGVSFAVLGHVASRALVAQVAIVLHTVAISLWVGALFPLYALCRREAASAMLPVLRSFGRLGWGITGTLLVTGVFLLSQLLEAPDDLLDTAYGRLLSAKLLLVLVLLGLGALNKFHLVPALALSGADRLRQSIAAERFVALLVLVLTAALTTLAGPAHMG